MFSNWELSKQKPKTYEEAYNLLFFDENIIAKQNRIASFVAAKKSTPFLDEKAKFGSPSTILIKMPKPEQAKINQQTVFEKSLESQSVLPIMLTHGMGDINGYYYRFLPDLSPCLFEGIALEPPMNLLRNLN